ncbi:MAG: hypothetical protein HY261_10015 [Chloroflexi bacterium]|nr:hypothetical protein [Chloroflexota bacterium]
MDPNRPEPEQKPSRPKQPNFRGYGCGCAMPGPAVLLLSLTAVLMYFLLSKETLRHSLLWLVLIPLLGGYALLYMRIQRYKE